MTPAIKVFGRRTLLNPKPITTRQVGIALEQQQHQIVSKKDAEEYARQLHDVSGASTISPPTSTTAPVPLASVSPIITPLQRFHLFSRDSKLSDYQPRLRPYIIPQPLNLKKRGQYKVQLYNDEPEMNAKGLLVDFPYPHISDIEGTIRPLGGHDYRLVEGGSEWELMFQMPDGRLYQIHTGHLPRYIGTVAVEQKSPKSPILPSVVQRDKTTEHELELVDAQVDEEEREMLTESNLGVVTDEWSLAIGQTIEELKAENEVDDSILPAFMTRSMLLQVSLCAKANIRWAWWKEVIPMMNVVANDSRVTSQRKRTGQKLMKVKQRVKKPKWSKQDRQYRLSQLPSLQLIAPLLVKHTGEGFPLPVGTAGLPAGFVYAFPSDIRPSAMEEIPWNALLTDTPMEDDEDEDIIVLTTSDIEDD